jgi:uncharacterized membrane protein
MKMLTIGVCGLVMFTAFGCSETSPEGRKTTAAIENTAQPTRTVKKPAVEEPIGGDANNNPAVDKPIAGEADKTFSLSVPFESVALTQGEEKSVLIGINRGENFREEVAIEVTDLPTGVTLATADPSIEHGSTDATLNFKAASDAALGDFTVKLTGVTASSGADFTREFKMTVAEK